MDKKVNFKNISIILIIAILIFVNIIVYIKYVQIEEKDSSSIETYNVSIEENEKMDVIENMEQLHAMGERERMEYYFSEFMDYIENDKYQEAYNLLYPEFREQNFKTVEDFKKYVNKIYPDFVSFSYNDIDRQGDIYVLTVTVINPEASKEESKKSQRIVIKENDFNNFVLSFQVI